MTYDILNLNDGKNFRPHRVIARSPMVVCVDADGREVAFPPFYLEPGVRAGLIKTTMATVKRVLEGENDQHTN